MSYGGGIGAGSASMGKGAVGSAVDERVSQYMSNRGGGGTYGGGGGGGGGMPQSSRTGAAQMMGSMGAGMGGGGGGGESGPTAQEIVDYARYIGMDPIGDVNLLWIAEEALCASLPEGWTEHTDQNGNTFYYNSTTGQSSWEHPLDEYYRSLFLKLKKILIDNRAAVKVNDSAVQLQCAIRSCYARRIFRRLLGKKRLDDAASDIQAVYRGHLVRLKVREESIKQWEELEKFSSTRLQATYRAHLVRRSIAKKREEWKREWRRRAATKLQSTWRGHVGRRIAREEEMYQALELDEYAVTKLQSVYRGHLGRNKFRAKRKQLAIDKILLSAAKIQAVYRGHLARLEANAERELQMAEIEFEAALRVQAVMRGHWGRQLMRFRRRNFLAAKLQSVYRGHIARLDVMVLRRFNAANKLQAVYRGHVSRRFMVHHRQVVAIIRLHEWEQACALKLQSVYRGHLGRIGGFRLIRQTRSALRLQATYRGHLERARLRQSLAEEYAAVQVQRVYNGHVGRLAFRRMRTVLGAHKAALNVQRVLRGHWVRLALADRGLRGAAALTLQRVYRGHLARAYGGEDPFAGRARGGSRRVVGGGASAVRHAALTLQRVYRGHVDRLVVQETIKQLLLDMQAMSADAEEEETAVLAIQLAWRCMMARLAFREERMRRQAAVCIQCAYRAKGARRRVAGMVEDIVQQKSEAEAARLDEESRLAAPSPAGSDVSRTSRASQVSRGSKTEKVEVAAAVLAAGGAAEEERPLTGQYFAHPITPMEGDPTATPGLSPEYRAQSRRSQRVRRGTQSSQATEDAWGAAMVAQSGDQTLVVPGTAQSSGMYPSSAPATAGLPGTAPSPPAPHDFGSGPGTAGVAGSAPATAGMRHEALETQTWDTETSAPPTPGLPLGAPMAPSSSPGSAARSDSVLGTSGVPGSAPAVSDAPGSVPGTAGVPPSAPPSWDVLMLEEEGPLVPLVDLAGGESGMAIVVGDAMAQVLDDVLHNLNHMDFFPRASHAADTADTSQTDPVAAARSRPQTRGSVTGSVISSSSVGTEQAREELAGIGGTAADIVDGLLTGVVSEFPDSVPSTRPGTDSALSSYEPEPAEAPLVEDVTRQREAHTGGGARGGSVARGVEEGQYEGEAEGEEEMLDRARVGAHQPQQGRREVGLGITPSPPESPRSPAARGGTPPPPSTPLESHPQTPAGSAPPTPGPIAPQASLEAEDVKEGTSRRSSRPGTTAPDTSLDEVLDTHEGQYGSPPGTGRGGGQPMADAPPARTAHDIAAEEERQRQEEEMGRQVQEMREELARVYERDLVTFFDLYLALSQPV